MSQASYEGMLQARPDRRPFVLTRASHLGGQRWAATWTGDNTASWAHLDMSVAMVLNLGLSGMPLTGPDIGGFRFAGTGDLFARWIGIGALLPFARGHTEKGQIDKEPWSFGPQVERTAPAPCSGDRAPFSLYPRLRGATEGLPICRPCSSPIPRIRACATSTITSCWATILLVVCRTSANAAVELPATLARWTEIDLGLGGRDDADLPRLFLRPGSILTLGPVMETTDELPLDPLELIVAPTAEGKATGWLYEDAGDGWGHREGAFRRHPLRCHDP